MLVGRRAFFVSGQTIPECFPEKRGVVCHTSEVLLSTTDRGPPSITKIFFDMKKNTLLGIDLKTIMQQTTQLQLGSSYNGVLTRDGEEHYRFEEAVRHRITQRNPKLFAGEYISLVHMRNGRYHCHMKTIHASDVTDRGELAFRIYSELMNAFEMMEA